MRRALLYAKMFDKVIMQHCQVPELTVGGWRGLLQRSRVTWSIDHGQVGPGYAVPTAAGAAVVSLAQEHGLALETTYTGKCTAALRADVAAGRVTAAQVARIKRRGCVVVRNVFERSQVEAWNDEVVRYIDDARYLERMKDKAGLDKYFSGLAASRPQIFSLYWSKPQMQARQHVNQATTRAWLNRLWTFEKGGTRFFDPDRQFNYADRIRRREPGDSTLGLSPHSDGGSVERWCEPTFRHVYREVFQGDPLAFGQGLAEDVLNEESRPIRRIIEPKSALDLVISDALLEAL